MAWARASASSRSRSCPTRPPWTSCSLVFSFNALAPCPDCWASAAARRWTLARGARSSLTLAEGAIAPFKTATTTRRYCAPWPINGHRRELRRGRTCRKKATDARQMVWGDQKVRVDYVTVGRPRDVLVHRVGGRAHCGAAPLPGGPVRQPAREAVGVLRHRAVPDVRRQAPEARDPGRDGGGQVHPRRDRDERGRLARLLEGLAFHGAGGAHRRPHREGDQGAPALPGGRGPGLLHARGGPRPRSRAARRSASAWPRRSARGLMGVLYILDEPSIGLPPARQSGLSPRSSACAIWATPSSWWSTTRTLSAAPTTSSTWGRARASTAARWWR